jgi:hypothetical protein
MSTNGKIISFDAAFQRALAATKPSRSSGIPSQAEYERNEAMEAYRLEKEVNSQSLSDRKEARASFLEAMQKRPEIIAERIGWMLDGNYGYGVMKKAQAVIAAKRMNRPAALTHMVAIYEWRCPADFARDAWKKLTSIEKTLLDAAVKEEIASAEKELRE